MLNEHKRFVHSFDYFKVCHPGELLCSPGLFYFSIAFSFNLFCSKNARLLARVWPLPLFQMAAFWLVKICKNSNFHLAFYHAEKMSLRYVNRLYQTRYLGGEKYYLAWLLSAELMCRFLDRMKKELATISCPPRIGFGQPTGNHVEPHHPFTIW